MAEPDKITLPIPGSKKKLKLPRWVLLAGGGVAILAVLLLKGKPGTTTTEPADGTLAADLAARLEEERQAREAQMEDLRVVIEEGRLSPIPEIPTTPEPAPEVTPVPSYEPAPFVIPTQQFIPGVGQVQTGELVFKDRSQLEGGVISPTITEARIERRTAAAPAAPTAGAAARAAVLFRAVAPTAGPSVAALPTAGAAARAAVLFRVAPTAGPSVAALPTAGGLARAAVLFRTVAPAPAAVPARVATPPAVRRAVTAPPPAPTAAAVKAAQTAAAVTAAAIRRRGGL
jgi:hypothetical protein